MSTPADTTVCTWLTTTTTGRPVSDSENSDSPRYTVSQSDMHSTVISFYVLLTDLRYRSIALRRCTIARWRNNPPMVFTVRTPATNGRPVCEFLVESVALLVASDLNDRKVARLRVRGLLR